MENTNITVENWLKLVDKNVDDLKVPKGIKYQYSNFFKAIREKREKIYIWNSSDFQVSEEYLREEFIGLIDNQVIEHLKLVFKNIDFKFKLTGDAMYQMCLIMNYNNG